MRRYFLFFIFLLFGILFVCAESYNIQMSAGERFDFQVPIEGRSDDSVIYENHNFVVSDVRFESAILEFSSNLILQEFAVGDEIRADVNKDGIYDLYIKLNSINERKAGLSIQNINEVNPRSSEGLYIWTNSKMGQKDLIADDIISNGIQTGQVVAEEGRNYAELGAASFFVVCILGAVSFVIFKNRRYKKFGY